jgi:beta-N-acetylhexosaminidase
MDLSRQIGNLFIVGFPGIGLEEGSSICHDIIDRQLGGVILFSRCLHTPSQQANIVSVSQLKSLCSSLQKAAGGRLLIGVDQEGGQVRRLRPEAGFEDICSAAEMGATGQGTDVTRQQARINAAMLASAGINCNFAPVVDCGSTPDNPIITSLGRSFSSNPEEIARHATAWIEEHRRRGVLSCLKHFPGHGSSRADSHLGFVDISNTWDATELIPYKRLLDTGMVELIMTGHLFNRNIDPLFPATLSRATIDNLLRTELGYRGVVISDDMQMKAVTDRFGFEEAVCKSLAAGVDMLVFGNNLDNDPGVCQRAIAAVINGLDRGIISRQRIEKALHRIEGLKEQLGKNHE